MNVEIPFNKTKLSLYLLGCLVFIATGVWLLIGHFEPSGRLLDNPVVRAVFGAASILFGATIAYLMIQKLRENAPALVVSEDGILDNSSGLSLGFVPWSDVLEVREIKVNRQLFIGLIIPNKQAYLDRQQSAIKRKLLELNAQENGLLVSISANGLQYKHEQLRALIFNAFEAYQSRKQTS